MVLSVKRIPTVSFPKKYCCYIQLFLKAVSGLSPLLDLIP